MKCITSKFSWTSYLGDLILLSQFHGVLLIPQIMMQSNSLLITTQSLCTLRIPDGSLNRYQERKKQMHIIPTLITIPKAHGFQVTCRHHIRVKTFNLTLFLRRDIESHPRQMDGGGVESVWMK